MQILADGSPLACVKILHIRDGGATFITSAAVYLGLGAAVIMQLKRFSPLSLSSLSNSCFTGHQPMLFPSPAGIPLREEYS